VNKIYENADLNLETIPELAGYFTRLEDLGRKREKHLYKPNKDTDKKTTNYEDKEKSRGSGKRDNKMSDKNTPKYCTFHKSFTHDNSECKAKKMQCSSNQELHEPSSTALSAMASMVVKILDAEYKKFDLKDAVPSHLDESQSNILHSLLTKYDGTFEGKLGTMPGPPYTIPLCQDAKPFASKPFSIPHIHVETVKTEIKRLMNIGVITPDIDSRWASPCFIIPKNDGTVCFLTDFRRLNTQLERCHYPIPKISTLLQGIPKHLWSPLLT
jgi:hypothetical protein